MQLLTLLERIVDKICENRTEFSMHILFHGAAYIIEYSGGKVVVYGTK